MQGTIIRAFTIIVFAFVAFAARAEEETQSGATELIISVADQRMVLLRDGMSVEKYKVSTSKFGLGDSYGSYKTPLGKLRVCEKIGESLPTGSVIHHRSATGEVLPVNAPGRDPIVTRIIWLEGLEERNKNAKPRGIYIHGTVEEAKIGEAVSYGCIRMRSREVVDVFQQVPVGTLVTIQQEKLPKFRRWTASAPVMFVSKDGATKSVAANTGSDWKPEIQSTTSGSVTRFTFTHTPTRSSDDEAGASSLSLGGSMLFADLPGGGGGGGKTRNTTFYGSRGPLLEPVGESSRSVAQRTR